CSSSAVLDLPYFPTRRSSDLIEFTIQQGKLWMLQCRVGKRTGFAAIKMAVDMVKEKLIDKEEAILRIEPNQLNQLLRPIFDVEQDRKSTRLNSSHVKISYAVF